MITFQDLHQNPLPQKFLESRYAEGLDEKSDKFSLVMPGDFLEQLFIPGDFMAINSNVIFYNEEECDRIKLTEEERYALLAHELGHYYDSTSRELGQQLRENNADDFAVRLGLGDYLVSGLDKIKLSVDERVRELIQERINRLHKSGFDGSEAGAEE